MDIFKTYKELVLDQLNELSVDESAELNLYGKSITYFRPYLTRIQSDIGKKFITKKSEGKYFIKRVK